MEGSPITAYIGLGANIGEREKNLDRAIELLGLTHGVEVTAVSSYVNTAPVGYLEQPDFLNAVVEVRTILSPYELLKVCGDIEQELKRERIIRWGPRTIDMDILLYGELIVKEEDLTIPHPRMQERDFVLKPLKEIAPQVFHPGLMKSVNELYQELHKSI